MMNFTKLTIKKLYITLFLESYPHPTYFSIVKETRAGQINFTFS